jgi:L-aspartate oxidase
VDLRADYIIVGSGIAALRAAVELAGAGDVLVLTKAEPSEGNTGYAQGGIAAAVGPGDSPELHGADTIAAGDGLCDERAVAALVEDGPRYVRELIEWGARFDREPDGTPALAMEAAHSARRVLHARDATGREIGQVLVHRVSAMAGIVIHSHARVVEVLVKDGRAVGAAFLQDDGSVATAEASSVLLATGGAGQVFRETTNPAVATGDGVAMAFVAGALVADLEFVQFHPTALSVPGHPRFLLSEALRGEGARLLNAAGEPFMERYDPRGDLAPRDRVARAIVREGERLGGPVYLSMEHLEHAFVHARFPLISDACRRAGLDLADDRIPIGPAAHYVMGGVYTDLDGRTSVPGLYAAGEVACTGVHGANRLASNSLLEGLVFGARAGRAMRADRGGGWAVEPTRTAAARGSSSASLHPASNIDSDSTPAARGFSPASLHPSRLDPGDVQDLMWRHVGLFRDRAGLSAALELLEGAWLGIEARIESGEPFDAETRRSASLAIVGRLIARAAWRRLESRGGHYRADYPQRDDINWKRRVFEKRTG